MTCYNIPLGCSTACKHTTWWASLKTLPRLSLRLGLFVFGRCLFCGVTLENSSDLQKPAWLCPESRWLLFRGCQCFTDLEDSCQSGFQDKWCLGTHIPDWPFKFPKESSGICTFIMAICDMGPKVWSNLLHKARIQAWTRDQAEWPTFLWALRSEIGSKRGIREIPTTFCPC